MQVKHKDIVQFRNFDNEIKKLVEHISSNDPVFHQGKAVKKSSKSRKEGGKRIPILKVYRSLEERTYRQKSKAQVAKAMKTLDDDVVVDNIAYCQFWAWRW